MLSILLHHPTLLAFIMDDSNVSPKKRMLYIMIKGIVTMNVSPLTIHPFAELFGRKRGGWKAKLFPMKEILVQVIKRARPDLKGNKSNRKIDNRFALIPKQMIPMILTSSRQ
jgi:hypothetical protein